MTARWCSLLLFVTLAVAATAAVFAIWPVVVEAPWEDTQRPGQEQGADTDAIRCEGALRLREAVIDAGIRGIHLTNPGTGRLTQSEYDRQLAKAERGIARYC